MSNISATRIRVGDRVHVRRERWRVAAVRGYERCQVLTVSGAGPHNSGTTRSFIAPFDDVERVERPGRLRLVARRRWRRQCRDLLASHCPSGSLSTPHRARIELMPHQLEPALALVRGLGSRVLIADEVGLGKTIQAGLIVSELRALGAERALVLTPASLREQWAGELRDRFGLDPAVLDMREARRRAASLPVGLNPWTTVPIAITSIDYVKRPEVLPAVLPAHWDVVIVDEAHGVTPSSERHEAVHALCSRAAYVVLLTATPHNGDRSAFDLLCRLGHVEREHPAAPLVFRRNRRDAGLGTTRRVHCLVVESTSHERRVHERLSRLVDAIRAENDDARVWLPLATLHKRALSSAHALHASIRRRLAALEGRASDSYRQLVLPIDADEVENDSADEAPAWASPPLADAELERRLLDDLAAAAAGAARHESKLIALSRLLVRLLKLGEPAIVFTEYRDTLLHVERILGDGPFAVRPFGGNLCILHGGLTRDQRQQAVDDFRAGRRAILLATDAGGQGLNLHQSCRVVINLELPWNPMRLEQRIGRVDRIGQTRRVHAFNLILGGTGEPRMLGRLKERVESARQDIDVADPLSSSDEEHAAFRLVVGATATDHAAVGGGPRRVPIPCLRLAGEAARECERLLRARGLQNGLKTERRLSSTTPWAEIDTLVSRAGKPLTRARLSSHVLVLFHSTVEDRSGRLVASQITAISVATTYCPDLRSTAAAIFESLETWRPPEPEREHHLAFWAARAARERAIADQFRTGLFGSIQPGLFDHRVEHDTDARSAVLQEAVERASLLEAGMACEPTRHRAALVLLP